MNDNAGQSRRRITLNDIAEAVGVSRMTVSLALRNHPRISEATRIKVQQKAEKLGYSPDPMLSALSNYRLAKRKQTTHAALAWVNPFRDPNRQHTFNEFELYWKGAEESAARHGYRLEEFATTETSLKRLNTIFKTRNIKGIIIALLCNPKFRDLNLDWHDFPWENYATVRFGRSTEYPSTHFVSSAQARNTELAYEKIRSKGYQRIGFSGLHTPRRVFCEGAYFAQLELPKSRQLPPLLFTLQDSQERRLEMLNQWLHKHRPDAILTDGALMLEMLHELGYQVPHDIGVATTSIHDTPIDAGIDQNPEEVGRAAVRMLCAQINEQDLGIPAIRNEILIEGTWVDGSMLPGRRND